MRLWVYQVNFRGRVAPLLRTLGLPRLSLELVADDRVLTVFDARIESSARRARVGIHPALAGRGDDASTGRRLMRHHLAAALHMARLAGVPLSINISDGQMPSGARFAYCGRSTAVKLLPDPYFFREKGYAARHALAAREGRPWAERSGRLVWRGRPNGVGFYSLDPADRDHPQLIHRLRLLHLARDLGLDVGIVPHHSGADRALLAATGFGAEPVPPAAWAGMKYALDIDGFTNAWDNLAHRLALGCCVLKVESPFGFRQWYYDRLRPFEHFVPVRSDLSDLAERLDWVRSHDAEARAIAAAGQAVMRSMTFESEMDWAAARIREAA